MRVKPFLMFLFLIVACLVPMVAQANAPDAPEISLVELLDESLGDALLASVEFEFRILDVESPAENVVAVIEVAAVILNQCHASKPPTREAFAWEVIGHRTQTATSPPNLYGI